MARSEQVRLDGPGVAGGEDGVDESVEPECGDHACRLRGGIRDDRKPRARPPQPAERRNDVGVQAHATSPVGPLRRSELGQQVVGDQVRPDAARHCEDRREIPFERSMLATHPRFVGRRPRRVRCRSRHADAIGNRVTSGRERAPVRLDEGPVEVEENRARHDPSPTGRSTDAQASADS